MRTNSRLVYSTATGRVKTPEPDKRLQVPEGDGIVRIRRETKGRKGKGVTTISGLLIEPEALKSLAKDLKRLCGSGGSVKDRIIEIQGDRREIVKAELERKGYTVKLAGG